MKAAATPTLRAVRAEAWRTTPRTMRRTGGQSSGASKRKPEAADRRDVARVGRVVAELPAQDRDVHVEGLGRAVPGAVPDVAHQLLAGDDLAGVGHEHPEQLELLAGELDLLAAQEHPSAVGVDVEERVLLGLQRVDDAAAQQRPGPGEQLGEPEGLGDVVVGPCVEPHDGVDLVGPGREDEHGHAAALLPEPAAHLEAVHLREPEVEHDQVGLAQGALERGLPVRAHLHLVALSAESTGERVGDRGVVLGEQHLGHGAIVVTPRDSARRDGVQAGARRSSWSVTTPIPRSIRRRRSTAVNPETAPRARAMSSST